jgi:hypothetical protein
MARRSATNRDIDALRAIAAAGGSKMAANRAFGRRRGFAEYWATRGASLLPAIVDRRSGRRIPRWPT